MGEDGGVAQLITPAELDRAKQHLVGTHEISLQRNGSRASLLALDYLYGLGTHSLEYAEQIFAVTAEDVRATAQRVIQLDAATTALVGP